MTKRMFSGVALLLVVLGAAPALCQRAADSPIDQVVTACKEKGPPEPGCVRLCTKKDKADADCVRPPKMLEEADPMYSEAARKAGVNGTVVLSLVVGSDGRPQKEIKVERSPGYDLDVEAIRAVRQWKFKPATVAGKPVAYSIKTEINFSLGKPPAGIQGRPPR